MSETPWTPGPWEINWFNCTANASDVAYARTKGDTQLQVGHTFWCVARSIGPITIDSNHWSGDHLDVSEADARLIAAAPEMAEALECLAAMAAHFPTVKTYGNRVRSGAFYSVSVMHLGEAAITVEDLHRAAALLSRIRGDMA